MAEPAASKARQVAHLNAFPEPSKDAASGTAKHLDEQHEIIQAQTEIPKTQPGFAAVWKNRRVLYWCALSSSPGLQTVN